jgi:bis(5'-nucleosyl)-tetraphosphatase (symmetrical)
VATFAVGDVHGCSRTFERLLDTLPFDSAADRLWLVGDVVGHGPDMAGVLRILQRLDGDLDQRLVSVLGNHDLRLIAARHGVAVPARVAAQREKLEAAPDGGALLDWLAARPVFHVEADRALVHAGLMPGWTLHEARDRATEARALLDGDRGAEILAALYAGSASASSGAVERAIESLRVMTTIRTLRGDGRLCNYKGSPETAPPDCRPWFADPDRAHRDATIVFGHWAGLGLRSGDGWIGLDSGCAWGGPLTAIRLEDRRLFQVPRVD